MGAVSFVPNVSKIEPPVIVDEFFAKLVSLFYNKENAKYDHDGYRILSYEDKEMKNEFRVDKDKDDQKKWHFHITTTGFNIIKKQLGINQSARNFAEGNGFKYKSVWIDKTTNQGFEGIFPHKYAEYLSNPDAGDDNNPKKENEQMKQFVMEENDNTDEFKELGLDVKPEEYKKLGFDVKPKEHETTDEAKKEMDKSPEEYKRKEKEYEDEEARKRQKQIDDLDL